MKATFVYAMMAIGGSLAKPAPAPAPAPSSTQRKHCSASLIAELCDYPEPIKGTAVVSSGPEFCWQYCHDNQPCSFVIFEEGNPYTGSGNCLVYHDQEYDPSKATPDGCQHKGLSVYGKPSCEGDKAAATAEGACAATASPSAIAEVCGYPTPPGDCATDGCIAAGGASDCLSFCAKAESCSYAIFNPGNEMHSEFYTGSCWIFPKGDYDSKKAKKCKGPVEQYVYKNTCPKPKPKPKPKPSGSKDGDKDGKNGKDGNKGGDSSHGDSNDSNKDGSNDGNKGDSGDSNSDSNGTGSDNSGENGSNGGAAQDKSTSGKPSSASMLSLSYSLAIGAAALVLSF